jgi:hypothetical protein
MPSTSVDQAPVVAQMDGYEARSVEWGDTTLSFETMAAADPAPLFKGLPDDRCQCAHYGYVFEGELTVRYADREETITSGQAYYLPPGHVPLTRTGAKTMEFTRTAELGDTMAVIGKNLENGVLPEML